MVPALSAGAYALLLGRSRTQVARAVLMEAAGRGLDVEPSREPDLSGLPPASVLVPELRRRVNLARRAADDVLDHDGPFARQRAVAAMLAALGPVAPLVFAEEAVLATLHDLLGEEPPPGGTATTDDDDVVALLDAVARLTPQVRACVAEAAERRRV